MSEDSLQYSRCRLGGARYPTGRRVRVLVRGVSRRRENKQRVAPRARTRGHVRHGRGLTPTRTRVTVSSGDEKPETRRSGSFVNV